MAANPTTLAIEIALGEMETNREAALVALLKAWRATNAPAIADVIDALSKELTEHEPPIRAVGNTSAKKAWSALATNPKARPTSLGRLLEVLPDGNDRCGRLDAIIQMDRDPRITPFVRSWLRSPPVHGSRRAGFFGRVVELLEKTKDVRILQQITPMAEKKHRSSTVHVMGIVNWKPLGALVEALAKVKPKELSDADLKMLEQIRELVSKAPPKLTTSGVSDPKTFFAKVYANPGDDEARAVLSDLLQQQGDPRGEFIALQLARHGTNKPRSARERELEATWGREWLGPLEPAIMKQGVVFERGFLAGCRYSGGSAGEKTSKCDEWSTVTHLDVSTASRYVGGSCTLLSGKPARRAMRHVLGLAGDDMEKLVKAGGAPFPWETLGMRIWYWDEYVKPLLAPAAAGELFKNVRKLVFSHASANVMSDAPTSKVTALLEKWPNVVDLEITLPEAQIGALASSKVAKRLERLTVRSWGESAYEIDTKTRDLRIVFPNFRDDWAQSAAQALPGLAKMVARVTVEAPGRVKLENDVLMRGRYDKMSIADLRAAAKAASLPFEVSL